MERLAFRPGGKSMTEMRASHIMQRDIICFGKEVYCDVLSAKMLKGCFGSIPIIDNENTLSGVVSDYDILNALKKGMDLSKTLAFEIMTRDVVSVKDDTPIAEVIELLQSEHFIRVPVIDAYGKLIGILTRRDILGAYVESSYEQLPGLSE